MLNKNDIIETIVTFTIGAAIAVATLFALDWAIAKELKHMCNTPGYQKEC